MSTAGENLVPHAGFHVALDDSSLLGVLTGRQFSARRASQQ